MSYHIFELTYHKKKKCRFHEKKFFYQETIYVLLNYRKKKGYSKTEKVQKNLYKLYY